ncbi:MBL fold metallo-hydrolase [Piscinibacter sp. XHJ-5]|uniref:MBL fold metallo-hydrolase n=1 Tax=Piscinibacter sp. XHJ-5 TaxID=3037797 RepID=UPI00329A4723
MMPAPDRFLQRHADGIHVIDTGFHRPRFDASYLVVEAGRGAFVDTGTNYSVPRLLEALAVAGLRPAQVDWVIATHVHLDHAGGVGLLMRHLPEARLLVHPRGAKHLIDPSHLMDSARAVYGDEEVMRSYGEVVGVDAQRVVSTHDGMTLDWVGRRLQFLDTPGHARHHHCVWDTRSRGFFTGDTFGLSYREFDSAKGPWLLPTTTPVQFEPEALRASVQRLLAFDPQWMYLTHFGLVGDVQRLGRDLLEQIDEIVALGRAAAHENQRHTRLKEDLSRVYLRRVREHGCLLDDAAVLELLEMDIELNAQGLACWLDRPQRHH